MVGVEIDMVVEDSLHALDLYEKLFEVKRVEVTEFTKGQNEVVFTLYGVRFHMLDANPEFQLVAPTIDAPKPIWFNVMVPDISDVFSRAISSGCTEIQPVTEIPDYGVSNAIFVDPFGYLWMLHQVHKEVSFEERVKIWEDRQDKPS